VPPECRHQPGPRRKGHELFTFLSVGGVGYIVDVVAFNAMRSPAALGAANPIASKVLAVVAATVVTYLGNRWLTWRRRPRSGRGREVSLFIAFNLVGLGISVAALMVSHDLLGLTSTVADNLSANVVGLALGTAFRFWAYRRFVFAAPLRPRRPDRASSVPSSHEDLPHVHRLSLGERMAVHIVSGSYGAGHDAAAHGRGGRLVASGHAVHTWDVVGLFSAASGRVLRWTHFLSCLWCQAAGARCCAG
jgi:putative flippase GtrA